MFSFTKGLIPFGIFCFDHTIDPDKRLQAYFQFRNNFVFAPVLFREMYNMVCKKVQATKHDIQPNVKKTQAIEY